MKKMIMFLIASIVIIASMTTTVLAEEENMKDISREDSIHISAEIKKQLNVQDTDDIVRIYNLSIHMAFKEIHNIDELLATNGLILSEYYLVQTSDNEISYKGLVDKKTVELTDVNMNQRAMKAFRNEGMIKKVSPDVEVYETYYLSGENCNSGSAIYYRTSKGDFVYYNHHLLGEGEYLFPIDDFCKYQTAIYDETNKHPDLDGGIDIESVWDLSPYDINSDTFNINIMPSITPSDNNLHENPIGEPSNEIQTDKLNTVQSHILLWSGIIVGTVVLMTGGIFFGVRIHKKKEQTMPPRKGY